MSALLLLINDTTVVYGELLKWLDINFIALFIKFDKGIATLDSDHLESLVEILGSEMRTSLRTLILFIVIIVENALVIVKVNHDRSIF